MSHALRKIWTVMLSRLALLLVAGATLGFWLGNVWMLIALVLAGYLAWHLGNIYRLHRFLRSNRRFARTDGYGIWADVFGRMRKRQKESGKRKKRLSAIVREFREATAALPDAIVITDSQMRIVWSNLGAKNLLGLHRSKDAGRKLTDLVRDPALNRWLANHEEAPEGLILSSPSSRQRKLRLRLFDYAQGQHLIIGRDITRIQQVEQMRKDFVANVSHELRTPLTVVSGYIETMADEVDADWLPIIQRVEEQTGRMRDIVEDLLTLSRLDSAESLEIENDVAADSLARGAVESAMVISEDQHEFDCFITDHLHLIGSSKDLASCFTNLTSNAVRYTPPGSRIEVRWEMRGDNAVFEVADNGPGISAQHLHRLTERFYRVSTDRSRASGGTGLGLAIVKHVLALHGAELQIDSKIGIGSRFRCIFPPDRIRDLSQERLQQA